ncbi:MAG: LPS export ABC transporter periplasmic protein LptC [Deltaproteobacteria bacterium]|nr:LPS export ABC transporter periplasmic protein LptC [Deltaproteobacteria bacterium]
MRTPGPAHRDFSTPRSPRNKKVPLLVRMRKLILLMALLFMAGLASLFYFGRSGLAPVEEPQGAETERPLASEELTTRSEGFDYTHYEEGRPVFRVKGDTQSIDREANTHLEGVEISLFQPDGQEFKASSQKALYRQQATSAQLEGEVHLVGPDQFQLWSDKLKVGKQGKRVSSTTPVRFEYGESLQGSSNRLRVEVPSKLFLLQGDVKIETRTSVQPKASLTASRGYFEERRQLLRAEGGVRLTYNKDFVRSDRLSAYLVDDRDAIRFVRANWNVEGRFQVRSQSSLFAESYMSFAGDGMSLLFDEEGEEPRKLEIEGSPLNPSKLETTDVETGNNRRITANYIVADFTSDALDIAHGYGQVHLVELPAGRTDGPPVREARSERCEAGFAEDGSLHLVKLAGTVDYREQDVEIKSATARANLVENRVQFVGFPVRLDSPRGEVTAPRIVFNGARDSVHASEGVRTALVPGKGGSVPGPLLQSGSGPVWVESEEASWMRNLQQSVFSGQVRAWRGSDLLLADELKAFHAQDRLEAVGNVKTVWNSPADSDDSGNLVSGVLEVKAGTFSYLGNQNQLRYGDGVEVLDGPRTMTCGSTRIELDSNRKMKRLFCQAKAHVEDRSQGKSIRGQRAVYDPGMKMIEIWGNPVTLKDRRGSQLQGGHVVYKLDEGSVEFLNSAEPVEPTGRAARTPRTRDPAQGPNTPAPSGQPAAPESTDPEAEQNSSPTGIEAALQQVDSQQSETRHH